MSRKTEDGAIGIFDSGIGGLTVMREIMRILPQENLIYLGDTARVPYGIRSRETVQRYAVENATFLLSQNIKLIVVACNTVSAVGIDAIREITDVPVIGVLKPGARAAVKNTVKKRVGVIGTEATIQSSAYQKEIKSLKNDIDVLTKACPLFVPLVEEGWLEGDIVEAIISTYLSELKESGIDTLVLGCTHYPLLKKSIQRVMGNEVRLIDSAVETARAVRELLHEKGLISSSDKQGYRAFYVTDSPDRFRNIGERFLGCQIQEIKKIQIPYRIN
ncbi:MAG: glutamate racemase [Nitrospirae bacterium]|nr:glutamate racemase [Nitrospirota bacterium]